MSNEAKGGILTDPFSSDLPFATWDLVSIKTLSHPESSPNLNPMEAVWNILKQRGCRRKWKTKDDLKRVIVEEWEDISLEEIQAKIDEMRERCAWLHCSPSFT